METDNFFELVKEQFGDKVQVNSLNVSKETLSELKNQGYDLSENDFEEYGKQAWLLDNKCPNCGEDLFGLFGNFEWGLVHGIGFCSNCKKVEFRYYHYVGNCKLPLRVLSVVGF